MTGSVSSDGHEEIRELLSALINIPSVNPAYDASSPGENAVGDELADRALAMGLEVSRSEVVDGRMNVAIHLRAPAPKVTVLVEGHIDTVGLPTGQAAPQASYRDGLVFGRGACDVKGGVTAAFIIMERFLREGSLRHVSLTLLLAVDEEHEFRGITHHLATEALPQLAIVLEPTGLRMVTSHNGVIRMEVEVLGRPAHTSTADEGQNAILDALHVVRQVENWYRIYADGREVESVFTVSTIRGGSAMNIVPGLCTVGIEIRVRPADDPLEILTEIRQLLEEQTDGGISARVSEVLLTDRGMWTDSAGSLPQAMGRALHEHGLDPEPLSVRFGTDGSKLSRRGVPTVVFGPGSIAQAHADEEWVELGDIARAASILHATLRAIDDVAGSVS